VSIRWTDTDRDACVIEATPVGVLWVLLVAVSTVLVVALGSVL